MSSTLISFLNTEENKKRVAENIKKRARLLFDNEGKVNVDHIGGISRFFDELSVYPKLTPLLDDVEFYVREGKLSDLIDILMVEAIKDILDSNGNLQPALIGFLNSHDNFYNKLLASGGVSAFTITTNLLGAYLVGICSHFAPAIAQVAVEDVEDIIEQNPMFVWNQRTSQVINSLMKKNGNDRLIQFIEDSKSKLDIAEKTCQALDNECAKYEHYIFKKMDVQPDDFGESGMSIQESKGRSEKYALVKALREKLHEENVPACKRIYNFSEMLNKPENVTLLNHRRQSRAAQFFSTIAHILTFGVIAKIKLGTFAFWKPKSRVLAEELKEKISKPRPGTAV